jgi:predicted transcriptional regulator
MKGNVTDKAILEIINQEPGASLYEISRLSDSSVGLVDGSIQRLEKKGMVKIRHILRSGRSAKEIYPSTFEFPSTEYVKLDSRMFPSPSNWKDTARVYALNRISIGISPVEDKEWSSKALLELDTEVKKDDSGNIVVKIPDRLRGFYLSENSKIDSLVMGNRALVNFITEIPIQVT